MAPGVERWRAVLATLLLAIAVPAAGQSASGPYASVPSVDWYYASAFGTGVYRAGERTVSALRIPLAIDLGNWGKRNAEVRLLAPLTVGAIDFHLDDVLDDPLNSVSMLTFTPGIELLFPEGKAWQFTTYATFGGGAEFDGDDAAWIYSAGMSARRPLPCRRTRCLFGLGLTWAGYRSNAQARGNMSSMALGLDFVFPWSGRGFDRLIHPGFFVLYRNYLGNADFIFAPIDIEPLQQEWELGLSLNASRPFSLFGYRFQRFGLSYRRGGALRGIHLTGSFPF